MPGERRVPAATWRGERGSGAERSGAPADEWGGGEPLYDPAVREAPLPQPTLRFAVPDAVHGPNRGERFRRELVDDGPFHDDPFEYEPFHDESFDDGPFLSDPFDDAPLRPHPLDDEPFDHEPLHHESLDDDTLEHEPLQHHQSLDQPARGRKRSRRRRSAVRHGARFVGFVGGTLAPIALLAAPTGEGLNTTDPAVIVVKPRIESITCNSGCGKGGRVVSGGTVRLEGRNLGSARRVVFLGRPGSGDDVAVGVEPGSDRRLVAAVPFSARSGPVTAWANAQMRSKPSRRMRILPVPAPRQTGKLERATGPATPGAPALKTAVSSGSVYAGGRGVSFRYRLGSSAAIVVKLVRLSDGAVLRKWHQGEVAPHAVRTLRWSASGPGSETAEDRYAFRLTARSRGGTVQNAASDDYMRDAFDVRGFTFPIRASHGYGDPFGVPRAGHRHQGQDVTAACGAPLVAVRGGVIKAARYQVAAGYYVVLNADGTGYDFFYAHLKQASVVKVGQRVYAGERIGNVGATGDATGCHLHFEVWTGPGWYSGGHPIDPAPFLRAWDRYS